MGLFSGIRIPVDDLLEVAENIVDFSDENGDLFKQILQSLEYYRSSGQWKGKDVDELIAQTKKNQEKYETALETLAEMGEQLKTYAEDMEAEDLRVKKQILAI